MALSYSPASALSKYKLTSLSKGRWRRRYYYGFPPYDHPGFKIGKFNHLREEVEPDELNRKISDADEECLRECVSTYFPLASASVTTLGSQG